MGAILRAADFKITGVGSQIALRGPGEAFKPVDWPGKKGWGRAQLQAGLAERHELTLQPDFAQNDYKLSFLVEGIPEEQHASYIDSLTGYLVDKGLSEIQPHMIYSSGKFLDILPPGVDKGSALWRASELVIARYAIGLTQPWRYNNPLVLAAGDSLNDCDLLATADCAILPSNADESLRSWAEEKLDPSKYYQADGDCAEGILEGIAHFGFPTF